MQKLVAAGGDDDLIEHRATAGGAVGGRHAGEDRFAERDVADRRAILQRGAGTVGLRPDGFQRLRVASTGSVA